MDLRVVKDSEFREQLTNQIEEANLKAVFEDRYGRGWQRKLGMVLDVPETTVNGWFKSGKYPALAKLAFGTLLSQTAHAERTWVAVKSRHGFAVCDVNETVGRVVAESIPTIADAMLIAAAPTLREACSEAFLVFDDAKKFQDDWWADIAEQLGDALDTADRGAAKTKQEKALEILSEMSDEEKAEFLGNLQVQESQATDDSK
jgi:hypothetical protein